MSALFQLTNWPTLLNAGNGALGIPHLLYKPGQIGGNQLFGYVVDFQLNADLTSIPEVIVPPSEPLASEIEQAQPLYNLPKNNPYKKLGIYTSNDDGQTLHRHFGIYLFNRRPYFYKDLLKNLTKAASLQMGFDGRNGGITSLWAALEEEPFANNTGGLQGSDSLSFWITANEEAPRTPTVASFILSIKLEIPGAQYNLAIPEGCLSYSFKVRAEPGDEVGPVRFAWQPGLVGNGGGYTLEANSEEAENGVFLIDKKLYLSADVPVTVIFKGWV